MQWVLNLTADTPLRMVSMNQFVEGLRAVMFTIEVNWEPTAEALGVAADNVDKAVAAVVQGTGASLLTLVRTNASSGYHMPRPVRGRDGVTHMRIAPRGHIPGTGPGPNVATGDYRRTINLTLTNAGGVPTAIVATNAPQAWALEYGIPGVQPPYPHWRPAVESTRPVFYADTLAAIADALKH